MATMKDYVNGGEIYEPPGRRCYMSIDVLPQLVGKKWGQDALNVIHSLRPSRVRLSIGELKCDARCWRVTVMIDKDDRETIVGVEQEVEVGCVGRENGADVSAWLEGDCK